MTLCERIERLERENRRWKLSLATLAIVAATAVCMGQAKPEAAATLRAARFEIVDERGKTRGVLGMDEDGPSLLLRNQQGKPVVQLTVPKIPDKPALYFLNSDGKAEFELAVTPGGPVLHLNDAKQTRVRLATNELNAPLVGVYDEQGKKLLEVTANK